MFKNSLVREIVVVLMLKLLLIFGLWYAFFRQPADREMTGQEVGQVLFGPAPQRSGTTPQNR